MQCQAECFPHVEVYRLRFISSITSSSLNDGLIGQDYASIRTWPHYHYEMQKGWWRVGRVGEWRLKKGCGGACPGAESIIWWKKSDVSPSPCFPRLCWLFSAFKFRSVFSSSLHCSSPPLPRANPFKPCSAQTSASPRLPTAFNPAMLKPPILRDCVEG